MIDERRSRVMRAVRSKNTAPEMIVRRVAHALGFRYRLHRADLPGKPDLTFPSKKKIVFVHGCWWHGHDCRRGARIPKTRQTYWLPKIARNRERDVATLEVLSAAGWVCMVIWECETKDREALGERLRCFLDRALARP